MDKISQYIYDELQPHTEQRLFEACLIDDIEGFVIELDADQGMSTIKFK